MTYKITIQALSSLFFKGNRSFDAGDDNYATSAFPPNPSAFFGFIQSILYNESNFNREINGFLSNSLPDNNLQILDITLELSNRKFGEITSISNNHYYPLPQDVAFEKKDSHFSNPKYLSLRNSDFFLGSAIKEEGEMFLTCSHSDKLLDTLGKVFISKENFQKYLDGNQITDFVSINDYITTEPKVGIGRKIATKIAEDGLLYTINMIKPEGLFSPNEINQASFELIFESEEKFPNCGLSRFGGEGKLVNYELSQTKPINAHPVFEQNEICKMVLTTPGIFKKYYPENILTNNGLKLLTVAINKYNTIGGWDMIKKQPKITYRAAPPGTVYFLQIIDAELANNFIKTNNGCPISGIDIQETLLTQQGYGIVYFGKLISTQN